MAESIEDRLDYVESEVISLSTVPDQIDHLKEALGLIWGILDDLTRDLNNAAEYAEDLLRLNTLIELL